MRNLILIAAAIVCLTACGTPNNSNIRAKENVQCKMGETMVCRDGYASRLKKNEPDAGEFCQCKPSDVGIDQP